MANSTCFKVKASAQSPPLIQHGNLVFQAHQVGWIVSGFFTAVAVITSFWLINKHLQWYTNKREQRHIIRILLMVPIYAIISFLSYLFWNDATPLLLIRDCYESTVLTAFFYLLLTYLSPNPEEQRDIFGRQGLSKNYDRIAKRTGKSPQKWMFPLGSLKWKPRDGFFFLQLMKWAILQYCVIRPLTTLAAVILNHIGLYCEDSWSPRWGQIYITSIVSLSVTIAMYCLLQMYMSVAENLKPQKPLLKLFAVKAVVFLTFWQASLLSLLSTFGFVKDTKYMTADDINTGIAALLQTFEMACFGFLHIRAFTYKVYRPPYNSAFEKPPQRTPRLPALRHALDFRETVREIWAGSVYMLQRSQGIETDVIARRAVHLNEAFGQSRTMPISTGPKTLTAESMGHSVNPEKISKPTQYEASIADYSHGAGIAGVGARGRGILPNANDSQAHSRRQQPWMGASHWAGHREPSEGLEFQIEHELQKRGYSIRGNESDAIVAMEGTVDDIRGHDHGRRKRSWWRNVYDRISGSQADPEPLWNAEDVKSSPATRYRHHTRHRNRDSDLRPLMNDESLPSSMMRSHTQEKAQKRSPVEHHQRDFDCSPFVPIPDQPADDRDGYVNGRGVQRVGRLGDLSNRISPTSGPGIDATHPSPSLSHPRMHFWDAPGYVATSDDLRISRPSSHFDRGQAGLSPPPSHNRRRSGAVHSKSNGVAGSVAHLGRLRSGPGPAMPMNIVDAQPVYASHAFAPFMSSSVQTEDATRSDQGSADAVSVSTYATADDFSRSQDLNPSTLSEERHDDQAARPRRARHSFLRHSRQGGELDG